MRPVIMMLLLGCPSGAQELSTDAAHEIRLTPAPPYPVRGPRFSTVTLDLYFAFGHPPSAVGAELARRAVESARTHDVRQVLRLASPGPISNSAGAQLGAEALLEAELEGKPYQLLDRLLHERAGLTPPEVVRVAVDAGLDGERLAAALADHRHAPEVERRLKEAQLANRSAGELLVNGRRSSVWVSEDGLGNTISDARKRAQAVLDAGTPLGRLYDVLTQPDEPVRSVDRPKRRLQPDLAGAPTRGPATAPVTIVIFSSLACGSCGDTADVLRRLRQAWPGRIREVWRNFVPPYVGGGSLDVMAAEIAAAATRQDRFWALHDLLFAPGRPMMPRRSRAEMESAARSAGVDLSHRDTAAERQQLERDQAEARRMSVPIAPSLLVNGVALTGFIQFERLDRAVRNELSRGFLDRLSP